MIRVRVAFILLSFGCLLTGLWGQYPGGQYGGAPYGQGSYQDSPDNGGYQSQAQGAEDVPGRPVARLSLLNGEASVRRADSGDWVAATVNAPLMVQDSLSVAPAGYAEVQFDNANILRIAGDSEARISILENGRFGVQVIKGLVTYRTLRQTNAQSEVATPQVAVRPSANGAIRVELLADGYSRITVRSGEADVYTPNGVEKLRSGGMMMVRGDASDPEYQIVAAPVLDDWDRFNERRDQDLLSARSYQYVSRDIYGAEDLDRYGRWVNDPQYGDVWTPAVSADWAPYRNGHWVWEDYYGWTWVPYETWGWAPYHYGNWYWRGGGYGWCWFPGHRYEHVFWRPALVAFFGFGGWGGGVGYGGGIGWVPLAPFERFHPWYGHGWYGGRNVVNNVTVVNNTNITNLYRNARVSNGVSGIGAPEFAGGQFNSVRPLDGRSLQSANLVRGALPMQPTQSHLSFANRAVAANVPRINPVSQQRFASTRLASPGVTPLQTSRVPFAQQQSSFAGLNSRGFAGVQRTGPAEAPSRPTANSYPQGSSSPGWQRFGAPQSTSGSRGAAPSQTWNSFGRPASPQNGSGAAPQASSPQRGYYSAPPAPRYSSPAPGGRALQVAPPVVQPRYSSPPEQRYSPPPSYSRPSAPPQQHDSAPPPQRNAQPQPSYSRPSPGGRGGGGFSRPGGNAGGDGGRAPSGGGQHGRR